MQTDLIRWLHSAKGKAYIQGYLDTASEGSTVTPMRAAAYAAFWAVFGVLLGASIIFAWRGGYALGIRQPPALVLTSDLFVTGTAVPCEILRLKWATHMVPAARRRAPKGVPQDPEPLVQP
jgi:hypothetical protein